MSRPVRPVIIPEPRSVIDPDGSQAAELQAYADRTAERPENVWRLCLILVLLGLLLLWGAVCFEHWRFETLAREAWL